MPTTSNAPREARLTEEDLVVWAERHGVRARLVHGLASVKTVAQAAQVMGVEVSQIAKSVLFINDGRPLIVLSPGGANVADRLVLDHVGGVRNRFRLARAAEVLARTGYPVGGVPPFGHPEPLRTLMDERVLDHDSVLFGGGSDTALLEVSPADVQRVTRAELGRFTQ